MGTVFFAFVIVNMVDVAPYYTKPELQPFKKCSTQNNDD